MGMDTITVHQGTDGERELKRRIAPLFEGKSSSEYIVIESPEEKKLSTCKEKKDEKDFPLTGKLQNGINENIRDSEYAQTLVEELMKSGVKMNVHDIVFITRDASGQIVWLEKGSSRVGLTHILNRHVNDFKNACGIEEQDIPAFLKKVMSHGKIVAQKSRVINGRIEYAKKIDYGGKYFILTAIGSNGFIVSAYPEK